MNGWAGGAGDDPCGCCCGAEPYAGCVRVGLARAGMVAGGTAIAVAVVFARETMATHQVARMQPLRIFQLVYMVMILVAGATLGEQVLQRRAWRWVAVFSVLAGVMVLAERETFPGSKHLELPEGMGRWGVGEIVGSRRLMDQREYAEGCGVCSGRVLHH